MHAWSVILKNLPLVFAKIVNFAIINNLGGGGRGGGGGAQAQHYYNALKKKIHGNNT